MMITKVTANRVMKIIINKQFRKNKCISNTVIEKYENEKDNPHCKLDECGIPHIYYNDLDELLNAEDLTGTMELYKLIEMIICFYHESYHAIQHKRKRNSYYRRIEFNALISFESNFKAYCRYDIDSVHEIAAERFAISSVLRLKNKILLRRCGISFKDITKCILEYCKQRECSDFDYYFSDKVNSIDEYKALLKKAYHKSLSADINFFYYSDDPISRYFDNNNIDKSYYYNLPDTFEKYRLVASITIKNNPNYHRIYNISQKEYDFSRYETVI